MIEWEYVSIVASTGIISVFLTLGMLSIVVYLTGLVFYRLAKNGTEKRERETNIS